MYIRRKVFSRFIDESGEERLYSVSVTELEQREFGAHTRKAKYRAARSAQKATEAANKIAKEDARIKAGAELVSQGSDNKELASWLKDPKYTAAVESAKNGGEIKSEKINRLSRGAEQSTKVGADTIAKLGKTKKSVRTPEGLTYKTAGREVNVKADNSGQTVTKLVSGPHEQQTSQVISKADTRRAMVVNNANEKDRTIVAPNMKVGKSGRYRKPKKIVSDRPVGINFEGTNKNSTTISSTTPNQSVKTEITAPTVATPTGTSVKIESEFKRPVGQPRPNGKTKQPKTLTTSTPTVNNQNNNGFGNTLKNLWSTKGGKAAIIGTGVAATGATLYGIHKARQNRKNKEKEREYKE